MEIAVEIGLVLVATMVASGVQSIAGMGFGLVAAPVLVFVFGPAQGVLWGNIIGAITSGALLIEKRRDVELGVAVRLVVGALPAILATIYFVRDLDPSVMNLMVGAIMLVLVAFAVLAKNLPATTGRFPMYFTGGIGGFLSASVGQAGPVLTAYARASRWPQRSFAATIQVYFLAINMVNIPVKLAIGYGPPDLVSGVTVLLAGLVGITLGTAVARRVSRRIAPRQARTFAMIVASVGAVIVLVRGLVGVLA